MSPEKPIRGQREFTKDTAPIAVSLRVTKTLDWIKSEIETTLGPEQVPGILIDLEWDNIRGNIQNVSIGSL